MNPALPRCRGLAQAVAGHHHPRPGAQLIGLAPLGLVVGQRARLLVLRLQHAIDDHPGGVRVVRIAGGGVGGGQHDQVPAGLAATEEVVGPAQLLAGEVVDHGAARLVRAAVAGEEVVVEMPLGPGVGHAAAGLGMPSVPGTDCL